jgi:glycine cleavage system regulatory protein
MQIPLVMTVIGQDRPGLVESVARIVSEHGGNWLESRMCRLGGEFAGLLRIQLPKAQQSALEDALKRLEAQGLTTVVRVDRAEPEAGPCRLGRLEIVGQDRPGIVRQISQVLAQQAVNVEELQTECASAPMSGETLFKAQARVRIPDACDVARLRRELEKIAGDLLVEVTFQELQPAVNPR